MVYDIYLVSRRHLKEPRYNGGNPVPELKERIVANVPTIRLVLDQIAYKWAILVITSLCDEPQRFNTIKRRLNGVTQKALTETLRRLERNGLVARRVIPVSPIAVEYSITPLGRTLQGPLTSLCEWALNHQPDIESAQKDVASSEAECRMPPSITAS
jgi:DNA-binding HxlR family transcriptional regulator